MTAVQPGDEDQAINVHVIALDHFGRALKALNQRLVRLEDGQAGEGPEVEKEISGLRRATQVVLEERRRLGLTPEGVENEHEELDFDTARDEVRRRLARIRAAREAS